jgi:hypothetical protein
MVTSHDIELSHAGKEANPSGLNPDRFGPSAFSNASFKTFLAETA